MSLPNQTASRLGNAICDPGMAQSIVTAINNASGASGVTSVNSKTGAVTLVIADVSDATTVGKALVKSATASAALTTVGATATGASLVTAASASAALAVIMSAAPVALTGSKASGAALASIIAALVSLGLATDGTTT